MRIVPALLSEKYDDFLSKLRAAESFADYVQIDLMDGIFVPTRSFPPEMINAVSTSLAFELHLMLTDPAALVRTIDHPGLRQVIFHCEAEGNQHDIIALIRKKGIGAGVAIKPETEIDRIRDYVDELDTVLFLTVDPCCYGNPFKPEVLQKIAEARRRFPGKTVAVDGGVSLGNLKTLHHAGVDYACVGSRIFLNGKPEINYGAFMEKLKEIEKEGQ